METISDPESSRRPHVLRSGDRIGVQRHAGAIRAAAMIPTTLRLALLSVCLKNGKRMPATGFGCVAVGPASRWFRQFLNPTKPGKTIVSEKNLNGQRPSRLLSRKNLRSERRRADPSDPPSIANRTGHRSPGVPFIHNSKLIIHTFPPVRLVGHWPRHLLRCTDIFYEFGKQSSTRGPLRFYPRYCGPARR